MLHMHSAYAKRIIQYHVMDYLSCVKVKFGVRRERVPFVLARDFEIIIDKHYGFDK